MKPTHEVARRSTKPGNAERLLRQEVLTLKEAAHYLRLPAATVKKYALRGEIPGRQVGKEWRFLKSGLQEWLSRAGGRTILLQQAGAFADDPDLDEIVKEAYAARARTAVE